MGENRGVREWRRWLQSPRYEVKISDRGDYAAPFALGIRRGHETILRRLPWNSVGNQMSLRGLIFDLDGTLADSGLDFDLLRREMGISPGQPVLESMAEMTGARLRECEQILDRHEWAGAARATLMPGVSRFLETIERRCLRRAILTRNSREVTLHTLERLDLEFDPIVAREDGPAKPDPAAIWAIRDAWGLSVEEIAIIGDFRFDIEAGHQAGVRTIWYSRGRDPGTVENAPAADFVLRSFHDAEALLRRIEDSS